MNEVTITKWDKADDDEAYTHVREYIKTTATGIKSHDSAVIGETVEDVIEAGVALRYIKHVEGDRYRVTGHLDCLDLERAIEAVLEYDGSMVAAARRQMIDAGFEDDEIACLTDIEIAAIDWKAREVIIEAAREISNPWTGRYPDIIGSCSDDVMKVAAVYVDETDGEGE